LSFLYYGAAALAVAAGLAASVFGTSTFFFDSKGLAIYGSGFGFNLAASSAAFFSYIFYSNKLNFLTGGAIFSSFFASSGFAISLATGG
jgi:hypothetical protein